MHRNKLKLTSTISCLYSQSSFEANPLSLLTLESTIALTTTQLLFALFNSSFHSITLSTVHYSFQHVHYSFHMSITLSNMSITLSTCPLIFPHVYYSFHMFINLSTCPLLFPLRAEIFAELKTTIYQPCCCFSSISKTFLFSSKWYRIVSHNLLYILVSPTRNNYFCSFTVVEIGVSSRTLSDLPC